MVAKKDKCSKCESFSNLQEKTRAQIEEQNLHRRFADQCREIKKDNKAKAQLDRSIVAATFDLQVIPQLPCSDASPLYYRRKLIIYNLTVHEAIHLDGYCYVWNEYNGHKSSNEKASVLYRYLTSLPATVKRVLFSSDSCNGQNRNQIVSSLMLYVVKCTNLETIEVNFLVPGHTQIEADSMHSAIENSKKPKSKLFTMLQEKVILDARRTGKKKRIHPYTYHGLEYRDIYDFKGTD